MFDPNYTEVRAVGNSLGIIIPSPVLRAYGLQRGDILRIDVKSGGHIKLIQKTNDPII